MSNRPTKFLKLILLHLVIIITTDILYSQIPGYNFRKKFTIDNTQVSGSSDLTDFPILFSVTDTDFRSTANGGDVESSNGFDITFTSSDGSTQLEHELESYNASTGEVIAWVKIPTLGATTDTDFFVYYGNSSQTTSQNSTDTWDSNYQLVYHMEDGTTDATSNNNIGTDNGTASATGQIGNARDFELDDSDFISVPDDPSLDISGNITISFWHNHESTAGPDLILKGNSNSYEASFNNGNLRMRFRKNGGNELTTNTNGNTGVWYYYTFVQSSTGRAIYRDGVELNSDGNTTAFNTNNDVLQISKSTDPADGIIDEVRISDVDRSGDWIVTEYNNQNNPGTFYSEVADPPVLADIENDPQTFTSGGSAVFVTSEITVSAPFIANLASATIQITGNYLSSDDTLTFMDTGSITGSWNDGNGTLTLSGTTSIANYQIALRNVRYENTNGTPDQSTRTISFTVNDGSNDSNTENRELNILTTITDLSTDFSNSVFHYDAQDIDGDLLTNDQPADGSSVATWGDRSDNAAGSGTDLPATAAGAEQPTFDSDYFGERGGILFDGVDNQLNPPDDNTLNTNTFNEKSFAVVFRTGSSTAGVQIVYEQGGGTRGYQISVVDGNAYAYVWNNNEWAGGDQYKSINLGAVETNETYIIVASQESTTNDTWSAAINGGSITTLNNVDFQRSHSGNPVIGAEDGTRDPTDNSNNPAGAARFSGFIGELISWNTALNSGQIASVHEFLCNKWCNEPPVIANIEGTNLDYTEGDAATTVTSALTVSDADNTVLDSAYVTISSNLESSEDVLDFTALGSITGSYNSSSGRLTLTGTDTPANYQTALRSVTYENTNGVDPSTALRQVDFMVFDWDDSSNVDSRTVNVIANNSTPVLSGIEGGSLSYTEGDSPLTITSSITASDPDDTNFESAEIQVSSNYFSGDDELLFTNTANITGSWSNPTGTLTLTGSATIAEYQTALRSVTYTNNSSDPVELTKTVSFTVNDGDTDSNTQSRDITVTAVNSKPILTNIEATTPTYDGADLQITNTIEVSDPDDTMIDSAIVVINGNFKTVEDSLIYSPIFGISGTYSTSTGRLKLTGTSSFSDYETALRSVKYRNFGSIPTGPAREVAFIVSDGALKSDSLKRTIEVNAVEAIDDLKVWLRADVGVVTSGSEVTTWQDQSGNGNDFTGTAGSGNRPTFISSSVPLGNQPSIDFAGNGDHFLDDDGETNYLNGMTEFTLFLVYKSDETNSDQGLWIAQDPSGADEIFTIRYDASGANTGGSFTDVVKTGILGNDPDNQIESFSDIQTTGAQITSLHWESGTAFDIYVDGILNNPSAAGTPPSGSISSATKAIVGKGGKDTGNNSWNGQIAEVILYCKNLTEEEREKIEDYLSAKYSSAIRKITAATGGETISADNANTTYTSLTGPIIQEGFAGELTASGTFILEAPSGYEWNTGATITVAEAAAYGGSTTLDASFTSVTSSQVTITVDTESSSNPGQLTLSGLEIRPTTGTLPNTGNIENVGSTGLGGATNYGTLEMIPGAQDSLIFTQQPTDANKDSSLTPSVRVQVVDQFGNEVENSGVSISVALTSGTGTLSGTLSDNTNSLGISDFPDLSIDLIGTKRLTASATGVSSTISDEFEIVNAGTLVSFRVERSPSGNISSKTAGQSFNTVITAIDGTGATVTTFSGTVVITSNCTLESGQGTTASFTSGVLSEHSVSVSNVGNCSITATNSAGSETGTSNTFNVSAGAPSEATSIITASPTVILNNGTSTSTVTVDVKDEFGNNVTTGGASVSLTITPTALGSLGSVTDNSDGTYSATLTSSTTVGTDNITGTLNSNSITDDADVEYAAFSHIWESQLGSASAASDWEDVDNWNVGSIPGSGSVVLIPSDPAVGNEYPVVDVAGGTASSISMEPGASLTISGGINFTIGGDLSGGSVLGSNTDSLTVGGDVLSVTEITVGTVVLNGATSQFVTDPHEYTNLVIDNSNGVSVVDNLIISDSLKMNDGELLIPSGKNLIADGISYGTGALRFQRKISGVRGWRILASPVSSTYGDFLDGTLTQGYSGSTLGNAAMDSLQPNVLTYLESFVGTDNQRYRAPSSSATSLTQGQGIFVFFFGDIAADSRYNNPLPDTLDVSGQEFNGTAGEVDFGVTYTADADTGWNLVGNPFGATIDWDDTPNWTKTNIESTIYIWDPAANGGNGEYLTWNGVTGTLGSGLIPPFQGFWIKASAASPELKVTTEAKTTGGVFLRKDQNQFNEPTFDLELSSNGLQKTTSFVFTDGAKKGKDPFDAFELLPLTDSRLEIYSVLGDNTPLVINNLPKELTNRYIIPVGINGFENGLPINSDYLLRAINFDNIPEEWLITITDNETGQEIDLRTQEEYNFFHSTRGKAKVAKPSAQQKVVAKKSSLTRFTLKITTEEIEANIPDEIFLHQNYPNPFNPETTIPFGLDVDANVKLEIFDIIGRKISVVIDRRLTAGTYNISFQASNLSSGVYFYRLTTDSNTLVKKFTLIK